MSLFHVPLADLARYLNPLDGRMWKCSVIDPEEIRAAVRAGVAEFRPWNEVMNTLGEAHAREYHVRRIATLVAQPSGEQLVVLIENHLDPMRVYLYDGNHRLAAASVRGDATILAWLEFSRPCAATEIFPGAVPARS